MRIHAETAPAPEPVDVAIPAKPEYVSIARLTAAAVAARHGFSYDAIEDLKIAVSEACGALIAAGGRLRWPITLHVVPEHDGLTVRVAARGTALEVGRRRASGTRPTDERGLGLFLMQCLVDEVDIGHTPGESSVTLRLAKRPQERSDAGSASPEQG